MERTISASDLDAQDSIFYIPHQCRQKTYCRPFPIDCQPLRSPNMTGSAPLAICHPCCHYASLLKPMWHAGLHLQNPVEDWALSPMEHLDSRAAQRQEGNLLRKSFVKYLMSLPKQNQGKHLMKRLEWKTLVVMTLQPQATAQRRPPWNQRGFQVSDPA